MTLLLNCDDACLNAASFNRLSIAFVTQLFELGFGPRSLMTLTISQCGPYLAILI